MNVGAVGQNNGNIDNLFILRFLATINYHVYEETFDFN